MSAVQLLAAAVLLLGVGLLAGAIIIIGLVRRVRTLEHDWSILVPANALFADRLAAVERDASHDPARAAGRGFSAAQVIFDEVPAQKLADAHIAAQIERRGPWNGQGWHA